MDLPKNINNAVRPPVKGGMKVRTFVFSIKDAEKHTDEVNT